MENFLTKLAFKILNYYKINYFIYPSESRQLLVNSMVDQVEGKFKNESGEFKRAQVMRAIMNSDSTMPERDIALAIELAIRRHV